MNSTEKETVAIIFGGKSPEHPISLKSAMNVIHHLDKEKYQLILIGIDAHNRWHLQHDATTPLHLPLDSLKVSLKDTDQVVLCPTVDDKSELVRIYDGKRTPIDIAFPVLHGPYGEDGTIQGLLHATNTPFVGSNTLSSAICMDKIVSKHLVKASGIPVADFIALSALEKSHIDASKIITKLGIPCFVKPADLGSSFGINQAHNKQELLHAIEQAFSFSNKILIEEKIIGRELECGVLGNNELLTSTPGEILPSQGSFYSYEAKYVDANSAQLIDKAELSSSICTAVQKLSRKIYRLLNCSGMARVDFFLKRDGTLIFNEINTIPGFTAISLYPRMFSKAGINMTSLLDKLIHLGLTKS